MHSLCTAGRPTVRSTGAHHLCPSHSHVVRRESDPFSGNGAEPFSGPKNIRRGEGEEAVGVTRRPVTWGFAMHCAPRSLVIYVSSHSVPVYLRRPAGAILLSALHRCWSRTTRVDAAAAHNTKAGLTLLCNKIARIKQFRNNMYSWLHFWRDGQTRAQILSANLFFSLTNC